MNSEQAAEELLTNFPFKGSLEQYAKDCFLKGAEWQSQQGADKEIELFSFTEWVGQSYIKLHGGWMHRFDDQRKTENILTSSALFKMFKDERQFRVKKS